MESIIRDHVMQYFLHNDFFSSKQYGFLKGRSTALQLLKIVDEWTLHLDTGGQIDCIQGGPKKPDCFSDLITL